MTFLRLAVRVTLLLGSAAACSQETSPARPDPPPPPQPSSPTMIAHAIPSSPTGVALKDVGVVNEINPRLLRRFQPIASPYETPPDAVTSAKIALGKQLYYETRLSRDRDLSCNSCHDLAAYGVDGQAKSFGTKSRLGSRNSPTVFNAALSFRQFWDGRAANVEEQAKLPIVSPIEMAMPDGASVVAALRGVPRYVDAFEKAFPGEAQPVTYDNVGAAIGAFERGLITPGRWDRFLKGEKDVLSAPEKEGLKVFLNIGCMVCHTGPALGGSMFERVGVVEPWPNQTDKGRAALTHSASDDMMFKVPTLRNVAKTAPYFHDGSVASLEGAVRMMGKHQLGLDLGADEVASIVTWLNALTSEPAADYVKRPEPF